MISLWLFCESDFLFPLCSVCFSTNVSPAGFYRLSVENFFMYVTAAREGVLPVMGASAQDASSRSQVPLHKKVSSRSWVPPSGFLPASPRRSPLLAWGFVNHDN